VTELTQRQGTWALTGGPRAEGVLARSGTRGPGHAIRIGQRGSEAGQGRRARVAVPAVRVVRSGLDGGDQRQAKGVGRAKRYPRSGSCDQDRTEGIRPRRGERLRVPLLLSAAVRSLELRQA
jgi:hypothetical protein